MSVSGKDDGKGERSESGGQLSDSEPGASIDRGAGGVRATEDGEAGFSLFGLSGMPTSGICDPLVDFFVSDAELRANLVAGGSEPFRATETRSRLMTDLLAFMVGEEEYALDIVQIQEIIKVPDITEVPRTPSTVLGVTSLRGTIVPVIDLRRVLHQECRPLSNLSRVLVLQGEGDPLGLLVDQVSSVVRLDTDSIQPVPRTMKPSTHEVLAGVGRDGERMLIILDLVALMNTMEIGT